MINREIRHPYQILDMGGLVIRQNYIFANCSSSSLYTFGAIFEDNNLDDNRIKDIIHSIALTNSLNEIVTIHLDGWTINDILTTPCINYWYEDGIWRAWDFLSTFLGNVREARNHNSIVVPIQHWKNDPQVYSAALKQRANFVSSIDTLDAASWEKRMRAKKHEAMAKMLGF